MGSVVHFTADDTVVEVVIVEVGGVDVLGVDEDNPTTRSFLAMLPMTLKFSDYGGREKVATPTGK
jgi:hypothetical protein